MKVERKRVYMTLTKPYLDALAFLIEEGVYLSIQEAIRDSLRITFGAQGIPPFYSQVVEEA